MRGSADSSVGEMQAAARAEQSRAEQADCWSQWPSKTTAGGIRALPEGGERGMTVSRCLPDCICSLSGRRGWGWGIMTISPSFLSYAFFKSYFSLSVFVLT